MQIPHLFSAIDAAGLPVLRVISVLTVLVFAGAGAYIVRQRRQLFERDPALPEYQDGPGVRHIRLELVLIVWGALMVVMLATLCAIWCA